MRCASAGGIWWICNRRLSDCGATIIPADTGYWQKCWTFIRRSLGTRPPSWRTPAGTFLRFPAAIAEPGAGCVYRCLRSSNFCVRHARFLDRGDAQLRAIQNFLRPASVNRAGDGARHSYGVAVRHPAIHHANRFGGAPVETLPSTPGAGHCRSAQFGWTAAGYARAYERGGRHALPQLTQVRMAMQMTFFTQSIGVASPILSNVFVPHGRVRANVIREERRAFGGIRSITWMPRERSHSSRLESCAALSDHYGAEANWRTNPLQYQQGARVVTIIRSR